MRIKMNFKYTRCNRGNEISTKELGEILANSKKITPLYFVHKLISRKKLYEILGLPYRHKDSIETNKMIEYFRSKLKIKKVYFVKFGGIIYLFEEK